MYMKWTMSEWSKKKLTRKKKGTLSSFRPSSAKSQLRGGKNNFGLLYDLDALINCSGKLINREKCENKIDSRGLNEFDGVIWSEDKIINHGYNSWF